MIISSFATAQTAVPYAEKVWESAKLADYVYDVWGLDAADIDGDGAVEILAATGLNSNVSSFSGTGFTFEDAYFGSSTMSYVYSRVDVANVDGDSALELVCGATAMMGKIHVIDSGTKLVDWELSVFGLDAFAVADIDNDGMSEIITGENSIKIFNADTKTAGASSINITGSIQDIKVGDVISGGNKEIVAVVDEFSGNSRLYMFDAVTLAVLLNVSISASVKCVELADVDSDGQTEIIIGDGTIVSMSYQGHLSIYESDGSVAWQGADLGKEVTAVEVADVDNDGKVEIVLATDRIEIWDATTKTSIWSSPQLISVGEKDALVLADLDGDSKLDIITRASTYSDNNRVLVYKVNGAVAPGDDNDDDTDDGTNDEGSGNETDSGSFLEDNLVMIVIVAVVIAAVVGAAIFIKKR